MSVIKWVGASAADFHPGRNGYSPVAIVNHIMCGTESGTDGWFNNPAAKVSAHYGVSKTGEVHQYVKDADTAYAVGGVNQPIWSLLSHYSINPNDWTISIEHEGQPVDGLTEAQYQATLWLHRKLIADHGIPLDTNHIVGHCVLDTVNRKDCPGDKFPWQRLYADLGIKETPSTQPELPELRIGSTGGAVKKLQTLLHVTVDGDFGPKTQEAVEQFQKTHGLEADGIVGPQTWAALN